MKSKSTNNLETKSTTQGTTITYIVKKEQPINKNNKKK